LGRQFDSDGSSTVLTAAQCDFRETLIGSYFARSPFHITLPNTEPFHAVTIRQCARCFSSPEAVELTFGRLRPLNMEQVALNSGIPEKTQSLELQ
jgi:hypothetical protein